MKLITVIVRSNNLDAIQTALGENGAYVTYASETTDLREPVITAHRGGRYRTFRQKLRIEIVVVNDLIVQDVIDAITRAESGGDSERITCENIFVTTLEQWVRIPAASPHPAPGREAVDGVSRRAS